MPFRLISAISVEQVVHDERARGRATARRSGAGLGRLIRPRPIGAHLLLAAREAAGQLARPSPSGAAAGCRPIPGLLRSQPGPAAGTSPEAGSPGPSAPRRDAGPAARWTMPAPTTSSGRARVRSRPANRTEPERGLMSCESVSRSVVLPAPLAPIRATISPCFTSSETSQRIWTCP